MSDKTEQTIETPVVEEVKEKVEKIVEKVENGDKVSDEKNGDNEGKVAENGTTEEEVEKNGDSESKETKEPSPVKRKSAGAVDATEDSVEEATPEKKAKLDEKTETDAKETTEVEA